MPGRVHEAAGADLVLAQDADRFPYLSGLFWLWVSNSDITDSDVDALVANPALGGLLELELAYMNSFHPRLSPTAEQKLRDRFGPGLTLHYADRVEPAQPPTVE